MQNIDYRFELSTVHVADNPLHVDRNANNKDSNFRNSYKTVIEQ